MKLRSKTKISKSKEINNLLINVIQTRGKEIKTDHRNSLHTNVIQTCSKKIKTDHRNNLHTNVIQTRSKKTKTNHRNNLHINVIQTGSKKNKTDYAKNLLECNCVKSQMIIPLQYLPDLVLESIFKLLTFHEIAGLRIMCRRFNEVCKRLLNRGYRIVHQNALEIQKVNEPTKLFKDFCRLHEINARLSMFDLAFYYHINANRCCFFPGKVLDLIGDYIYWMEENFKQEKAFKKNVKMSEVLEKLRIIELACNKALDYAMTNIFPTFNISIESTSVVLSSSTPFIFPECVLKSALGKLKFSDFYYYKRVYVEGYNFDILTMKNHLRNIKIKYDIDNPIRGLDRRLVREKVLGKFYYKENENKSLIFLVHWKEQKEAEFVQIF